MVPAFDAVSVGEVYEDWLVACRLVVLLDVGLN